MNNTETGATVSADAARFVASLDASSIPALVAEKARNCVFYGFGIGLLCLDQDTGRVAERAGVLFDGEGGSRAATLLASGLGAPASSAAFANAVLLHSRCQEDTSGTAHLGVVALAVGLALLESGWGRAEDLLPAIVAGYEVAGNLEAALGRDTMASGLRASSLYGTLAASATAARMLRLNEAQIDAALANAAGFAGGTLQSIPEGSDEWRYQVGIAARTGLLAAGLAQNHSISARRAFEGGQGFVQAFARRALNDGELLFGERWRLPDVTFKPYPVCAHNQTVCLIGAQIHDRVAAASIAAITLCINPYVVPGMLERGPFGRVAETLMSSYFCCASACLHGSVTMAQLGNFEDPAVRAFMPKIEIELDPRVPFPSTVARVRTLAGEVIELTERRAFSDFSLDRAQVRAQLVRLAEEEQIPSDCVGLVERFSHDEADPKLLVKAFARARDGIAGPRI